MIGGKIAYVQWNLEGNIATNLQTNLSFFVGCYVSINILHPYNVRRSFERTIVVSIKRNGIYFSLKLCSVFQASNKSSTKGYQV